MASPITPATRPPVASSAPVRAPLDDRMRRLEPIATMMAKGAKIPNHRPSSPRTNDGSAALSLITPSGNHHRRITSAVPRSCWGRSRFSRRSMKLSNWLRTGSSNPLLGILPIYNDYSRSAVSGAAAGAAPMRPPRCRSRSPTSSLRDWNRDRHRAPGRSLTLAPPTWTPRSSPAGTTGSAAPATPLSFYGNAVEAVRAADRTHSTRSAGSKGL